MNLATFVPKTSWCHSGRQSAISCHPHLMHGVPEGLPSRVQALISALEHEGKRLFRWYRRPCCTRKVGELVVTRAAVPRVTGAQAWRLAGEMISRLTCAPVGATVPERRAAVAACQAYRAALGWRRALLLRASLGGPFPCHCLTRGSRREATYTRIVAAQTTRTRWLGQLKNKHT